MSEHNIVIKKEVEDPSYSVANVNYDAPHTATNYEVSTEFVKVKIEKADDYGPPISHIKDEPLDLTPERPDSPQLPDSTTGPLTIDPEHCQNVEVEVTLELLPDTSSNEQDVIKQEQQNVDTKSVAEKFDEKLKRNELKKKFVIEGGKFSCLICPRLYMTKASIVRHLLNHTEKDIVNPPDSSAVIKCDECGKTFKNKSNLVQHSYIHLDKKLFQCDQCDRSFTLKSNLIRHQGKNQCKLQNFKNVCEVCNKGFPKDYLLRSHLKKHSVERPFACDDCGMNFKYKSTLVRHLQHHNGVKPYSCNICDKKFTHLGLIKPHMRMHTGEKPYTCPVCNKKFSHKHNMMRHTVRHDKVVNLNCPVCDRKFPKESRLKYHMRTHVDEKSFSCGICPKKFSHRQNVIRHYSRKHPDSIYESTETDASVALKVWNEVKNNTRSLSIDTNKSKAVKVKGEVADTHEDKSDDAEEILPDIKETPQVSFEVVNIKVECDVESE